MDSVESWHALGVLRSVRNIFVYPVLAFAALGRLTEIDREAVEDQELLSYKCSKGKVVPLPAELPSVHRSASGAKVGENNYAKVKPRYCKAFANHGMYMERARLAWFRHFVNRTDANAILTSGEQDALNNRANAIVKAALANVVVPERRLLAFYEM